MNQVSINMDALMLVTWALTIYAIGTIFGVLLTLGMKRYKIRKEIGLALNTDGIRRDEHKLLTKNFNRLKSEVDSVFKMVKETDERILRLEQHLNKGS